MEAGKKRGFDIALYKTIVTSNFYRGYVAFAGVLRVSL